MTTKRERHFERIARVRSRYERLPRSIVQKLASLGYLTKEGAIAAREVLSEEQREANVETATFHVGTIGDFVSSPEALVFIDWSWSGQAAEGLALLASVLEERKHPSLIVSVPDTDTAVAEWLSAESRRTGLPLHGGGHGSLLFVRFGKVCEFIVAVHKESRASLRVKIEDWLSSP